MFLFLPSRVIVTSRSKARVLRISGPHLVVFPLSICLLSLEAVAVVLAMVVVVEPVDSFRISHYLSMVQQ